MSAISGELFPTLRSFTADIARLDLIQGLGGAQRVQSANPSSEFLSSDAMGRKRRLWNPGRGARLAVLRAIFLHFPPIPRAITLPQARQQALIFA